jgi:aminoglycoside phosphotransferase (APT) family kinase protein
MSPAATVDDALAAILRHLSDARANGQGQDTGEVAGWRVARLQGGRNNLLYRLEGPAGTFVAKFVIRDARDRAGREYNALAVLQSAGLQIAPRPVLLDRDSYCQPLVAQEWLDGEALAHPPETDMDWARLAEVVILIHSVRPGREPSPLRPAVITAFSPEEALQRVADEFARMPAAERLPGAERVAARLERMTFASWSPPRPTLVRCDPNVTNVVRRAGTWACADWEYSGWGDPAYDVAEMMLHPSYRCVPESRWEWFGERVLEGDAAALERLQVYRKTINVWWLGRLSRLRYETLGGMDPRLAQPHPDWESELAQNYEYYLRLAERI